MNNEVFIQNSSSVPKEAEVCECGYFSDDSKILIKTVNDLKLYACNILRKCLKTEYLKDADEYLSDIDDFCSKSALEKMTDLENILSVLGYYISNRDDDCEIFSDQLELKGQEINSLGLELHEVKQALNTRESELSGLSNLFFDLKQKISQLTFICQALNNVDSQEKFAEIKERATVPNCLESCKLEYEMNMFKKYFARLNSHIEENALKIISLSEDLKKIKSELAAAQTDGFKLRESNCVFKNTATKSIQTSEDVKSSGKDKLLTELENKNNDLLEEINYLRERNTDLRKDIDDLYNSDSERIEHLKEDLENRWKIKTEMLVKDLEQKYDQELSDQEKYFAEELRTKIQEVKQENLKKLQELNEEIEEMKFSYNKELSTIKKQYEDQLASVLSEKEVLKQDLENKYEKKISNFNEKYIAKQKKHQQIYSQLNARLQFHMEEVEKLKNQNTPSNQLQVIEKLKEKINELSDDRDMLQKKNTKADLLISELKKHNKHLEHELKKITEESEQSKISKLEEANKELLCDLDQKKAKIMTLQSNNESMLKELKKLKEMLSSKASLSCKCKGNSKESHSDAPEKNEDKKDRKIRGSSKESLDSEMKITTRQKSNDENATPIHNDYSNMRTPDQNAILCVGGGSGPANMVKSYWLEGMVQKKDKEIQKLREEVTDLRSQLKTIKLQPLIKEEKQLERKETEAIKSEATRTPMSPLQEIDENVTVQLKSLHPYPGGAVPKNPRKHTVREKPKPYEKHQNVERLKKENNENDHPTYTHAAKNEHMTKKEVINQLLEPECKQQ